MNVKVDKWHPTEKDYFELEEKFRDLENRFIQLYNNYDFNPIGGEQ